MAESLSLASPVFASALGVGAFILLALVAGVVLVVVGVYAKGDQLLEGLINHHATALGKVLKEAAVTVHSVTPTSEPDPSVWRTGDDEEDDEFEEALEASGMPEGDYDWFLIDATIEPKADEAGSSESWEPTMVHLAKNDGKSRHALEFETDCLVARVERWQGGEFSPFERGSLTGAGRLRFHVGVTPGIEDVRFTYLGASFGQVRLPARSRSHAS